jgi:ubiquinone/menaquinone biosynthesis C-methylase UbiE
VVTELIVWEPDGSVQKVSVPDEGITIGRKPTSYGASYCTNSHSVSRQHCKLVRLGDAWYLEDLGSSNGSRVNGQLADGPTEVRSGDVIAIGGSESGITAQLLIGDPEFPTFEAQFSEVQTQFARWEPIDKIRNSYDIVAERYAVELADDMLRRPLEKGIFVSFVDLVATLGPGLVGDVGCGPGHVTKHLASMGLEMVGIDISAAMIAQARIKFPAGRFRIASMLDLPVPTDSWIGAVSLYATLHCPADDRERAHAETARVVRAGGFFLHGFYVSAPDQPPGSHYHLDKWFGFSVDLDTYFVGIEDAAAELDTAGFDVVAALVREPMSPTELPARRCYMMGRRR